MKKNLLTLLIILLSVIYGGNNLSAQNEYDAQVGNTKYATIDEAIANWTNGSTLTLLADVTLSDVITLKSTEHHILDLSTYTMTAATGKNAIVIKACGNGSSEKTAITIKADATNPGGINAGTKYVIYYNYADGGITAEDRPIIYITGGVFTGSSIYFKGSAARKAATLKVEGGIFNCSIQGVSKSKLLISGGIFNKSVSSNGDSTAYRLISGGTFISLPTGTMDAANKYIIGTRPNSGYGVYNVGVYVNDNNYFVVGGEIIEDYDDTYVCSFIPDTEAGNEWLNNNPFKPLKFSSANPDALSDRVYPNPNQNGLYYTSIKVALDNDNSSDNTVYVHTGTLDLTAESEYAYNGTIKLPKEDSEFTVIYKNGYAPTLEDVTTDITDGGKGVAINENTVNGITTRVYRICNESPCTHVARIIGNHYASLNEAASNAEDGDVITLMKDTQEVGLELNENVTIDFNNFTYTATSALTVAEGKTITLQNGTITSSAPYVISTSGNLTIQDMTINGTVEYFGGELITDKSFNIAPKKYFKGLETEDHTQNWSWSTISTPIAGVKFSEPEENEGIHDLYCFNEEDELWEYYKDSENGEAFDELELGRGYLYANTHDIIFKLGEGSLNTSSVKFPLSYTPGNSLAGFHMIGNPFTYSIDKDNNLSSTATLANGFYVVGANGTWIAKKWTDEADGKIAPMESVLIKAKGEGTLTMSPASTGSKRAARNENSYLSVNVASKTHSDVTHISFNEGMGLDKINHRNPDNPMLYIPVDGKNYAIAMMNQDVKEVPVYFNANRMAEYTISIEQNNCEFSSVVLVDKLTGIETNMLIEDYTFMARTFDDANRFVIRMSIEDNDDSETENFAYVSNGSIVIEKIEGNANIRIFDIMGRHIMGTNATGNVNIPVETMSTGMYIIQMADDNGVKVQKIIIE